jgi:hypothetical protein
MTFPAPRWARAVPLVLVLLLIGSWSGPAARSSVESPGPSEADVALYDPVLAAERDAVIEETAGRLSHYRIEATLTPGDPAQIVGRVDLTYFNDTGRPLDVLYLRLYANDDLYGDGSLTLGAIDFAEETVMPSLSVEETVAEVPLPSELDEEETIELSIDFTANVPVNPSRGYGMYGVETSSGTWALAHWYPVLAGYGPDGEWNLLPPSVNGDPIFTNTALYELSLTAPSSLVLVTTGSQVGGNGQAGDGMSTHEIVTGPVRDVTIVADDNFAVLSQDVDGTTVNSWYNPGREEGAALVLDYGVESLRLFNELFGTYPYAELDLVDVAVGGGAAGIEFPQLMFIGDSYYDNPSVERALPGFFEYLVVHEVAHQWWYGLVGNDHYFHAFIDEGLTNYVSTIYFERRYGADEGRFQVALNLELPYLAMLFEEGDQIVDQPTDDFANMGDYGVIIYCKGALGFEAVRETIGDDAFFAGLQAYAAEFRFAVATPADLLAAFEASADEDLTELWRHWFEAPEGTEDYTPDDYQAVLREVGR